MGIFKTIGVLFAAVLLGACVAGQDLTLEHTPEEMAVAQTGQSVEVVVTDDRPYVVSGKKDEFYIGHYRAGFGNTWDVTTDDKVPLSELVTQDLNEELENLGFDLSETGKTLSLSILDWNFDSYINARFWYEIALAVTDVNGVELASDTVKDEIVIKGNAMVGVKYEFEEQMPVLYGEILEKLVRKNDAILNALQSAE